MTDTRAPVLKDPVTESTYRGRDIAITVRNYVYDFWVNGKKFDTHVPEQNSNKKPFDPFDPINCTAALHVLLSLIDDEDKLREQFPLGVTVTTCLSNHKETYAVGDVVGYDNRVVLVKITETTYATGHRLAEVGSVQCMLPIHLRGPDPYPEHTKLKGRRAESQTARELLEWLLGEGGYTLATWEGESPWEQLTHAHADVEDLLARWLGIDRAKLEQERQAMLAAAREQNTQSGD